MKPTDLLDCKNKEKKRLTEFDHHRRLCEVWLKGLYIFSIFVFLGVFKLKNATQIKQ